MDTATQIAFEGTAAEQELASRAFEVMRRKAMLFGANAPIKMTVGKIAAALTGAGGPMAGTAPKNLTSKLEATLKKNKAVFAPGEKGEYITTKAGRAPSAGQAGQSHTFRERLNTEATTLGTEESQEYENSLMSRTANRAERSVVIDNIVEIPTPITSRPSYMPQVSMSRGVENQTIIPQHLIPQPPPPAVEEDEVEEVAPTSQRTQEPAVIAPTSGPVAAIPTTPTAPTTQPKRVEDDVPVARRGAIQQPTISQPQPQQLATAATTPAPTEEAPALRAQPETPTTPTAQPSAEAPTTPITPPVQTTKPTKATPTAQPTPVAPAITGPVEVRVQAADGPITVDLRQPLDELMENEELVAALLGMIERGVGADARLISFGSEIFPEEAVERFSKGDFRRIKEYLDEPETGGVASDRDIMAEVLNRRTDHPDYERVRFSLNYRLLKEKKDFEFMGIDSDRLWINAGASPVPAPARKPAEIGQDYRFLEDPATSWVEDEEEATAGTEVGPLEYALTYYEYENGLLPYDRRFKRLFPGAVFEDQRASLLRFEIPQLYGALLGELRYSTGNRGGFIMGLGELFTEHMVPGAKFTLTPTDRGADVFEINFTRNEETEANLLQYDERRGRYVFRPVLYTVDTDPSMLLTQEKFGKLQGHKKLEEAERKRPDISIVNAFEVVAENTDGKLWAAFDDIFPVVNIDRPISRSWLKTLLSGAYPFFYPDEETEGAYFYDPAKRPG